MTTPKRPRDTNQLAKMVVDIASGTTSDEPRAAESAKADGLRYARVGGLKGGKARAENLTAEERRAIAVKAARSRWDNKD